MSFVHLHVHSQYSLLEATCRFGQMLDLAKSYEMPAVAVTDNGNMFGAIEFYFAAKKAGVKPIIGMDVYLAPKSRLVKGEGTDQHQPLRRLVLLAENYAGYQNLCQLSSIGYQEGFYYKPRIDDEVLEKFSRNIIVLSGGLNGDLAQTFLVYGEDACEARMLWYQKVFGDRFYLEICRTGLPDWKRIIEFYQRMQKKHGLQLVASNDVHYLERDDQLPQEVLICIGTNRSIQDETRYRLGTSEFYFKSPQQMRELFHDIPEACDNTLKIAERCQVKFDLTDSKGRTIYHLPTYPTSQGVSLQDEIRRLSFTGLEERLIESKARGDEVAALEDYHKRLDFELGVINAMDFNGYFLIVQDFIGWAKRNHIPVGPGRGSGAGSLVAYCLRITDLDPIIHKLVFERFLNPERISMPDFDIDFCQDRRGEVIQYVTEKYGKASVSQIITYGKLQARAALRDVGRVLGMSYAEVDTVAKLIPEKLGITLKEAIEMEARLRDLMELDPQVANMMAIAQKIEGLVRHAGIHAAGVIIADGSLVEKAPLYRGVDGENVVQFDMKHAEKIGLIKFDFLGLKTLTVIHDALELVKRNQDKHIRPEQIPLADPGIYEILSKGDNLGVFQFEGEGITDVTRKIKPTCFADITAINALYRPGPMDMIPEYTLRKHGQKKVEYLFDSLAEILQETYGIIIYQEQVQLIAAKIASYSLGEADMLRRAMGKKIAEEMAQHRSRFLEGAKTNGYDATKAEELFDLMQEFANYGFNKSHAAAYCVVAAQTAWLKHYYPVEFYSALLSSEMDDTDKIVRYMNDVRKHGINVEPPHINFSEHKFTCRGQTIYFGLGAIKGVGESAVEAIMEARASKKDGKFEDLQDFFNAVDLRRVNKKTIECLIKAGAFDGFGFHRAQLFKGYVKFLAQADLIKKDKEIGQVSLFSVSDEMSSQGVVLDQEQKWNRQMQLHYEKEVLGFFLSDHPLKGFEEIMRVWRTCEIVELVKQEPKKRVVMVGLIGAFREIITKKGTRMAFAGLEDTSGTVELVIFPDVYAKISGLLKMEAPLLVAGTLEREEEKAKILVDHVSIFEDSLKKTRQLVFRLDESLMPHLDQLQSIMLRYPGQTTVKLELQIPALKKTVSMDLEEPAGVSPSNEFFENIHGTIGRTDFILTTGV